MLGILGDDLSAVSQGLPLPLGFIPADRMETAKALGEGKERVLAILKSKALSTRGTARLSAKLSSLVHALDQIIERDYLQIHMRLLDKMSAKEDIRSDILALITATTGINNIIQEIHSCMSLLKTRFN